MIHPNTTLTVKNSENVVKSRNFRKTFVIEGVTFFELKERYEFFCKATIF